ncbi:hypothetical protein LIA77_07923 [Sarocladium implicatum]|nr:hypothetical protein LIA77_07923 [Sarocladium implicatum]
MSLTPMTEDDAKLAIMLPPLPSPRSILLMGPASCKSTPPPFNSRMFHRRLDASQTPSACFSTRVALWHQTRPTTRHNLPQPTLGLPGCHLPRARTQTQTHNVNYCNLQGVRAYPPYGLYCNMGREWSDAATLCTGFMKMKDLTATISTCMQVLSLTQVSSWIQKIGHLCCLPWLSTTITPASSALSKAESAVAWKAEFGRGIDDHHASETRRFGDPSPGGCHLRICTFWVPRLVKFTLFESKLRTANPEEDPRNHTLSAWPDDQGNHRMADATLLTTNLEPGVALTSEPCLI